MISSFSGPCATSAPETLVSKLADRIATLAAYNAVEPFEYTSAVALADRRVWWASKRKADAEKRLARLVKGTVKYTNLCNKLYGQDTVPTGPGVNLFEVGTLAYVESPSSDGYVLVPCTVVKVTEDDVQVKINTARCGYARGTLVNTGHRDVIPRTRVEKPKSRDYVINPGWIWAQS